MNGKLIKNTHWTVLTHYYTLLYMNIYMNGTFADCGLWIQSSDTVQCIEYILPLLVFERDVNV
jgi:hypothetical protein